MAARGHFERKVVGLTLFLTLISVYGGSVLAHRPSTVWLQVDCDAGDDLESIVHRAFYGAAADKAPDARRLRPNESCPRSISVRSGSVASSVGVEVRGTCTANLVVPPSAELMIIGEDPETSVIQGVLNEDGEPTGAVILVERSAGLEIHAVTISNGMVGIHGDNASIHVSDSHFRQNWKAISLMFSDAYITRCLIESTAGRVAVGVYNGYLTMVNTDIFAAGSGGGRGIFAEYGATAVVDYCEISGQRSALTSIRGSFVKATNLTTTDTQYDARGFDVNADMVDPSMLGVPVSASLSSTVLLRSSDLDGHVYAHQFGQVLAEQSRVAGHIFCDPSSDAQCVGSTIEGGSSCGNCPQEPSNP